MKGKMNMKNKFEAILTKKNEINEMFKVLDDLVAHKEDLYLTDEAIEHITTTVYACAINSWICCLQENL